MESRQSLEVVGDGLSHFYLMGYRARAVMAVTTEVVRTAQRRHQLDPLTTIALGRAISSVALLASTLKNPKDYVHGVFAGDGVLQRVVAECNGQGDCRGYTSPLTLAEKFLSPEEVPDSVGQALGQGRLTLTRGRYGENAPYMAVVDLFNGEISADVARFLTESEQIPSAVAAGVKLDQSGQVLAAGGFLVQRLGGATISEEELKYLEDQMARMQISERLAKGEVPEAFIKDLQPTDEPWGLLSHRKLSFKCTCSRDKMALTAMSLGELELRDLIEEVGKIEMNCSYCSTSHQFKIEELLQH